MRENFIYGMIFGLLLGFLLGMKYEISRSQKAALELKVLRDGTQYRLRFADKSGSFANFQVPWSHLNTDCLSISFSKFNEGVFQLVGAKPCQ